MKIKDFRGNLVDVSLNLLVIQKEYKLNFIYVYKVTIMRSNVLEDITIEAKTSPKFYLDYFLK